MKNDEGNSQDNVSILYVLPVFAALLPVAVITLFGDSLIIRAIFGGWNTFILIPTLFLVTKLVVDRLVVSEKKREKSKDVKQD